MMDRTAKLLTEPSNYAVVQLPGTAFPGVVFQGESSHLADYGFRELLGLGGEHAAADLPHRGFGSGHG